MTEFHTYATTQRVGRKKQYPVRITLPLSEDTIARIDALRVEGEARLDVIRRAIDKEIERRERRRAPKTGNK